jgi:hypothetical protein
MFLNMVVLTSGALWAVLLIQNLVRYFHGWGHTPLIDLVGLVPLLGLAATAAGFVLIKRERLAIGVALLVLSVTLGGVYLLGAETGTP